MQYSLFYEPDETTTNPFAQFRAWAIWFENTYGSPPRVWIPDVLDKYEEHDHDRERIPDPSRDPTERGEARPSGASGRSHQGNARSTPIAAPG